MTTTPQDDGMREQLLTTPISRHDDGSPMYLEDVFPNIAQSEYIANVMQLITAQREQDRLEARIDELERNGIDDEIAYRRKAELQTELQRLKAGGTTGRDGDE